MQLSTAPTPHVNPTTFPRAERAVWEIDGVNEAIRLVRSAKAAARWRIDSSRTRQREMVSVNACVALSNAVDFLTRKRKALEVAASVRS